MVKHLLIYSNVIFTGALSTDGGALAIIGGVEYGICDIDGFSVSLLLDLINNLSLFLQQIIKPVPSPAIYDNKFIKQKSNTVISII